MIFKDFGSFRYVQESSIKGRHHSYRFREDYKTGLFFTASVSIINGDDAYILGSLLFTYVLPQVVYFPKRFCHDDSSNRNKHRNLLDKYSVSDFSNRVPSICFIT